MDVTFEFIRVDLKPLTANQRSLGAGLLEKDLDCQVGYEVVYPVSLENHPSNPLCAFPYKEAYEFTVGFKSMNEDESGEK